MTKIDRKKLEDALVRIGQSLKRSKRIANQLQNEDILKDDDVKKKSYSKNIQEVIKTE